MLLEQEADVWGFAHLTFQEYLCAVHWDKTGKAAEWDSTQWQKLIADNWWHETLRLYAAQSNATALVNACIALNTDAALGLAASIADEALKLEDSLRNLVIRSHKERAVIRLRKEPLTVPEDKFIEVFKLSKDLQPLEYIRNEYEEHGEVVVDHATGLIWQRYGSDEILTYQKAQTFIKEKLNDKWFAGHNDWRLPTIPELMSLLEPEEQSNRLFINPVFDKLQRWCWSADMRSPESAWSVYFDHGCVNWHNLDTENYVRVVRS